MINRSKAALILAVSVLIPAAHAAFLPGTVPTIAGGASVNPGNATGSPAGTLLASSVVPFSFTTTAGTTSGMLCAAVFRNPSGTLDFYYQVSNAATSASDISRETDTSFTGFATQTGFRLDGSLVGCQNGGVPPISADRDASGSVVGFSFTPPNSAKITPGTTSTVLVISTDATNFAPGNASLQDGGNQTVAAFQPALPPPTTIQICKVAGSGVAIGTNFTFSLAGNAITIPAGAGPGGNCNAPLAVPPGQAVVTESPVAGTSISSITTVPSAALVSGNLGTGTATVTVAAGTQTTVIFVNGAPPPPPPPTVGMCTPAAPIFVAGASAEAFQVRYFTNLAIGDSFIDITNTGASSTTAFPTQNGNLNVNVYTFSPDEQLISCCCCPVTPDGLISLSVRNDLISNTLTPGVPTSVVTKLVATDSTGALAPGLAAYGTTLHAAPAPGVFGATETRFTRATLSAAELARITQLCAFIQTNGSGFGVCKSCRFGGLGASHF
ncbi:MAG: hypothetical protein ACR2I2_05060 [Bryobacteraceae bacterium]